MNSIRSGYRAFTSYWFKHWLDPATYYYWLKYKIQRANRGWADCDIWSLDCYLASWLPDALRRLKETKHGVPFQTIPSDPEYIDSTGNFTEDALRTGEKNWNKIMDEMIQGFEAKNRIDNHFHLHQLLGGQERDEWFLNDRQPRPETMEIYRKSRELEEEDYKIFQNGLKLFIEHFESLWD